MKHMPQRVPQPCVLNGLGGKTYCTSNFGHTRTPAPLSRLLDPHTLHILSFVSDILSMQLVNCDSVVLFCTCNIYLLSWERDPSSVALPDVSSIFFFPHLVRGSQHKGCRSLYRFKAHQGKVIVILGLLHKCI